MHESKHVECERCGWPVCSRDCQNNINHASNECKLTEERGSKVSIVKNWSRDTWHDIKVKLFNGVFPSTCVRFRSRISFRPIPLTAACCRFAVCYWKKIIRKSGTSYWSCNLIMTMWKVANSHRSWKESANSYRGEDYILILLLLCDWLRFSFLPLSRFFKCNKWSEEEITKINGVAQINGHELPLTSPSCVVIYHQASFFEHSCRPNLSKSFSDQNEIILWSPNVINTGDHLTISYTDVLWETSNRRHHLQQTKHFDCDCERCSDVTEYGTFFSSLKCLKCPEGMLTPNSLAEWNHDWK